MNEGIKIGQIWKEDNSPNQRRVLAFSSKGEAVTECIPGGQIAGWNIEKYPSIFHTLISDPGQPWLPLPEDHKIISHEDRLKHPLPECAMRFNAAYEDWRTLSQNEGYRSQWHDDDTKRPWVIPTDFTFEPKKPKYRLFEIAWTADGSLVDRPGTFPSNVALCPVVDGYRVGWGFTDAETFDKPSDGIQSLYDTTPCDHTGNRKYAIGRLEE